MEVTVYGACPGLWLPLHFVLHFSPLFELYEGGWIIVKLWTYLQKHFAVQQCVVVGREISIPELWFVVHSVLLVLMHHHCNKSSGKKYEDRSPVTQVYCDLWFHQQQNVTLFSEYFTPYMDRLCPVAKLKLSDHSQDHSKGDKELARWNEIVTRLVKKSVSHCDSRPANHFVVVSIPDWGTWPDFSLHFTTGSFIFLGSRLSFVRNVSLSYLYLLIVLCFRRYDTDTFYELIQFL